MEEKKLLDGTEVAIVCPECDIPRKLVVRTNRQSGHQFLGCPNWPECGFTRRIPEDLIMVLHGAMRLPGFEG